MNCRFHEAGSNHPSDRLTHPLLKPGQLQRVARGPVPLAFEHLQGGRLHTLPGQPVPEFNHPHSGKSVSLCSGGNSRVSVYAHCRLSCRWAPPRRAWLRLLYFPLHKVFTDTVKMPPSLLFSRLSSPSPNHLYGPPLDSAQYAHVCLVLGSAEGDPELQMWLTRAGARGRTTPRDLLATLFPMQPRMLLVSFSVRARCLCSFSRKALQGPML